MKVLVTGAGGQVGQEVLRLGRPFGADVVGLDRAALDVTDAEAVRRAVAAHRPDAVIHAAAYTAVDRAEAEPERAFAVNRDGARHVAAAAAAAGAALVHLSTDYVFDGTKGAPYLPGDAPSPLNVYGASKAAGEDEVQDVMQGAIVLRTAWVFARNGENFVTAILRLAAQRPRLRVVDDQWGHPTPAAAVAHAALVAAQRAREGVAGRFHVAGSPLATWADLAEAAVRLASVVKGVSETPVDRILTAAYPTPARRPARVELELRASRDALGLPLCLWMEGLTEMIQGSGGNVNVR